MRAISMLLMGVLFGCGTTTRTTEAPFDLRMGENPEAIPLTKSQRAGRTVLMGNSMAAGVPGRDFQQTPGPLRWSPWEGYCCDSGARTRECVTVDAADLTSCRDAGSLAVVCKQLEGCSGPECFCCSHGLEYACSLDRVEAPPEHEQPRVPERKKPSVWSPY